jgi:metallophosphoesterase superfamily enzyme
MPEYRPRLTPDEYNLIKAYRDGAATQVERSKPTERNVFVVGDLHEPFTLEGYLEHCKHVYDKFNCNHVVFIGDIIDNHFSSYHETVPDGYGAGAELDRAIDKLSKWHDTFPNADVILGNHDLLVQRKVMSSGLSRRWIKAYEEVLEVPNWKFHDELEIDGVLYQHGTGTSGMNAARKRAMENNQSVVIGHIHTEASVNWHANKDKRFYGMMVGCGVNEKAYAMEYGKNFPRKMIISCGVVLSDGTLPPPLPQV